MNITENIKEIRKRKKISQQEIAEIINISRVQYNRIETGKSEPTVSMLQKIANALDIPLIDFFNNNDSLEVTTKDKTLIEKIRLIEQLDDNIKASIYTFIDVSISNKKLKDNLANLLAS